MIARLGAFRIAGLFSVALSCSSIAQAAPKLSPKALQKAGARLSACPTFIGHLKSGLYTAVAPEAMCGSFGKVKSKKFKPLKGAFSLAAASVKGSVLQPISNQQGDSTTESFEIQNYPALISYEVDGGGSFKMELLDMSGKKVSTLADLKGASSNTVTLNAPGKFSLRISATPSTKDGSQPTYSVSMRFMEPYEGFPVSMRDLAEASIKPVPCPKSVLAGSGMRVVDLPSGTVCANRDLYEAGMTAAPVNLGTGLFLATAIEVEGSQNNTTLPFRVMRPTQVSYEVDDPSPNGSGSFKVYLIDLETGKETLFINVRGSVSPGVSTINTRGDFYLRVEARSSNPDKHGALSYSLSLE